MGPCDRLEKYCGLLAAYHLLLESFLSLSVSCFIDPIARFLHHEVAALIERSKSVRALASDS